MVIAGRDTAAPPGAAGSAAATGVLIELANALGVAGHDNTFVLASTSGDGIGAAGAKALLSELPQRDTIAAVIVVSQPGPAASSPPYAVETSSGQSSGSIQLERTAELASATRPAAAPPSPRGSPSWRGRDPLGHRHPGAADRRRLRRRRDLGRGRAPAAGLRRRPRGPLGADHAGLRAGGPLDRLGDRPAPRAPGPRPGRADRVRLQPGPGLGAGAARVRVPHSRCGCGGRRLARAARGPASLGAGLVWAATRALPLVGALAALYALSLVGAIPRPPFPFDPGLYEFGVRAALCLAAMVLVAAATVWTMRSARPARGRAAGAAAAGSARSASPRSP